MEMPAVSEELPVKVMPYCQVPELKEALVFKILLLVSYGVKNIFQNGDIVLALLGLTEVEITDHQARRIARQFVAEGLFELVGEDNSYAVTSTAKARCQTSAVRARVAQIDGSKDRVNTPRQSNGFGGKSGRRDAIKRVTGRGVVVSDSSSVVLVRGIPSLSADKLNKFFPLLMKVGGNNFRTNARQLASELGFDSPQAFSNALVFLKKAGWIVVVSRGVARWNLEKIPSQWRTALAKKGEAIQEAPAVREDDDENVEDSPADDDVEEVAASEAEEVAEADDDSTDDDVAVTEDSTSEVEADPESQSDPIDESEAQRLFGLLLASTVEGLYLEIERRIEHLPEELQIMIRNALVKRITT